jgi:hypothetical protein
MGWLESLPTDGLAFVVVGGFVVFTLLIGWVLGKITSSEVREAHNDLAGFILAVIGVVYAVLLAFVAIGVWERFDGAESRTYDEAGALGIVYRDAGSFPQGTQLRADLHRYTDLVINDEWEKMRVGKQSETADELLEKADRDVRALPVPSARLQDIHAEMLTQLSAALLGRDARLSEDATGISPLMWAVLAIGAAVTIAFTYLFGFRHPAMQMLMTGSLGFLISLVLFLTIALDYPFRGSISVSPEAFRTLQETFASIGQ